MTNSGKLFIPVLIIFITVTAAAAEPVHSSFLQNGVTAHRGNSSEFPENSLPAFQSGMELGADWIELDLFLTKDGQLVVIHDVTTKRVGDKDLNILESTYQELLAVDIATDFRRRNNLTLDQCPPERIPLLEDVLQRVMSQRKTRVSIQPKMDCVAEAIKMIQKFNAEEWVGFNDGNLQLMTKVKQLAPELTVFWDRGASTDIDQDIRIAKQLGFAALVFHQTGITAEKVLKVKQAGIEPGAWTVNDLNTMERFLDLGVVRLYTDDPRQLMQLKKHQRKSTGLRHDN